MPHLDRTIEEALTLARHIDDPELILGLETLQAHRTKTRRTGAANSAGQSISILPLRFAYAPDQDSANLRASIIEIRELIDDETEPDLLQTWTAVEERFLQLSERVYYFDQLDRSNRDRVTERTLPLPTRDELLMTD